MKKIIYLLIMLILISCNANIIVNNGEFEIPEEKPESKEESAVVFSGAAPSGVNATKSYYGDSIVLRWNEVPGADYYTIEKTSSLNGNVPDNAKWTEISESIIDNTYSDYDNLKPSVYYSYRVKAHTLKGDVGKTSEVVTGTILASPSDLSVSKGTSTTNIVLSWEQMPFVESYNIYKSQNQIINGAKSEYVTTINASDSDTNVYSYQITGKEGGVELYFAIEAVGPTGDRADLSLPRYGYTYVPGAPTQPEISTITKGESTSEISFTFKSEGDDVQYLIRKSAPGFAEIVLFDSAVNELPEPDENGFYTLSDNDVSEDIKYSYSVMASNTLGKSEAAVAEGYILSPVKDVKLLPTNDGSRLGYELSYKLPVGSDDQSRKVAYSYKFVKTFKNGETEQVIVHENDLEQFNNFFSVEKNPTKESEMLEIRNVAVTVMNSLELSSKEVISDSTLDIPAAIESITASSNSKPLPGDNANSKGVYPVHVKWISSYDGSRVLTRIGSDGSTKNFEVVGNTFDDTTTDPLVIYKYYIDTTDELGRSLGAIKYAENAYGAITFETYGHMFESISLKPFVMQEYVPDEYKNYWKQSKIATLVNYGNASDLSTQMKALDTAEDKDHFHEGSRIYYHAEMKGIGGLIVFEYNNFGENANWACTGAYTMDVNASGTGSASSSSNGFTITGMYPGKVSIEKISVKNKGFLGNYVITINYSDGSGSGEVAAR